MIQERLQWFGDLSKAFHRHAPLEPLENGAASIEVLERERSDLKRQLGQQKEERDSVERRFHREEGGLKRELYDLLFVHGHGKLDKLAERLYNLDATALDYELTKEKLGDIRDRIWELRLQEGKNTVPFHSGEGNKDLLQTTKVDSDPRESEVHDIFPAIDGDIVPIVTAVNNTREKEDLPHWSEWLMFLHKKDDDRKQIESEPWNSRYPLFIASGIQKEYERITNLDELRAVFKKIKGMGPVLPEDVWGRLKEIARMKEEVPIQMTTRYGEKVAGGPYKGWQKQPIGKAGRIIFTFIQDEMRFRVGSHEDIYATKRRKPKDQARSL